MTINERLDSNKHNLPCKKALFLIVEDLQTSIDPTR